MEDLKQYLKYYFLEDYLFGEVSGKFHKEPFLTAEDFFAIIIWKSSRSKTKFKTIPKSKGELTTTKIKDASKKMHGLSNNLPKNDGKMLNVATSLVGVGIPVASAILAVCNQDYFTVVDYRALASLAKFLNGRDVMSDEEIRIDTKKRFRADPRGSPRAYLEYRNCCKKQADELGVTLRDFDRMLVGYDLYAGKGGLKELADNLTSKR